MELPPASKPEKVQLTEINQYLTCYLCKGYLIDATTISECLHSFCRSCIIKFLQDNSYCPVCELIINKAKPNLKLDKTLQDIVYKLVPELFLQEMMRRKTFYKDHTNLAAKASPEERGEDTERTIFNPKETISLSLEYICDDSAPGAIRIPGIATDPEALKNNGSVDEGEVVSEMKRYLLCPGMCRVEVLKKFVRNKYNVDTNKFFIDILYKRVPLPDHYTLIDIAYIYSWQRNELMKFFFRIIDKNQARNTDSPVSFPQFIPKHFRRGKFTPRKDSTCEKKNQKKFVLKVEKTPLLISSDDTSNQFEIKAEPKQCGNEAEAKICGDVDKNTDDDVPVVQVKVEECSDKTDTSTKQKDKVENNVHKTDVEPAIEDKNPSLNKPEQTPINVQKIEVEELKKSDTCTTVKIKKEPISPEAEKADKTLLQKMSKEFLDNVKMDIIPKQKVRSKPVTKSYTSITLNRTENVEIITKIEPVANKDGKPIGHHIVEQTIMKGSKVRIPKLIFTKKGNVKKISLPKKQLKSPSGSNRLKNIGPKKLNVENDIDDEKSKFFKYMELKPVLKSPMKDMKDQKVNNAPLSDSAQRPKKQIIISKPPGGQKRKNTSPIKNDKAKVARLEAKKSVKIILQDKPTNVAQDVKSDKGLQSLINTCKIPSSLSITIKESSEKECATPVAPPVKNYIEILKLPDESNEKSKNSQENKEISSKLNLSQFCDNDSEQKVDQDLSEIAKSLTERIPMSTTISHLVGPKLPFQIPVKTNITSKQQIQPSPVPDISSSLTNLNSKSPQTFQKIFEESLKKPPEGPKTSAIELPVVKNESASTSSSSGSGKRNLMEIALQLFKKNKHEQEKKDSSPLPKVPIPRLPMSKSPKLLGSPVMVPQTVASLHSSSLGMNYTVSVGQQSPSKVMKSNGIISPVKADSVPGIPECKPSVSPINDLKSVKNDFKVPSPSLGSPKLPDVTGSSPKLKSPSPKHSPKSSPLVKHMYAPLNQRVASPKSPKAKTSSPSSSVMSKTSSPTTILPASPTSNANELLEKYNIQNLAQFSASLNLNPSILATSNQIAAFQHAMLLKHFEMQNRQNWLNLPFQGGGPLLQYEKYLQSLNGSHSQT